jgi:hypothetical protein
MKAGFRVRSSRPGRKPTDLILRRSCEARAAKDASEGSAGRALESSFEAASRLTRFAVPQDEVGAVARA